MKKKNKWNNDNVKHGCESKKPRPDPSTGEVIEHSVAGN